MPLLVHGVTRSALAPQSATGHEPAYETVLDGELAGVVSRTADEEALPTRANLLHHTRVLEHVGAHTTVIPMRFGVLVPDDAALIDDFLVPERDGLLAGLDRLEGHVELRLRGQYDEAEVIREVLDADPRAARLRGRQDTESKVELGERIVAGIERRREADLARATEALEPRAAASTGTAVSEPLDAFALSFLVAESAREAFDTAVELLGAEFAPQLELELIGPVPPFSFAATEVDRWA